VNTLVSLLGSCVSTFIVSSLIHNRFDMVHVQNATLAGGVAAGSGAALHLSPAGALAVGLTAGALSTLGFTYLTPALERSINLGDTCGVNNLHGLPGILGGVVAGLASFGAINAHIAPHGTAQLGWQIVGVICTVGIGGIGGWVAGYIAAASNPERQRVDGVLLFDDGLFWTEECIEMVNRDGSVMGVPSVHGGQVYTSEEGRPAATQLEAAVGMVAGKVGAGGVGGGDNIRGAGALVMAVADEGPSGSGSRIAAGDTGARGDQAA
jgi:ammonium transporter Rh